MDPLITATNGIRINRDVFVKIIEQGIKCGCFRFVKQAVELWLKKYPKDLLIEYLYAKVLTNENDLETSTKILKDVVVRDPQFIEGWDLLLQISSKNNNQFFERIIGNLFVFDHLKQDYQIPKWARDLHDCLKGLNNGNHQSILNNLNAILAEASSEPITGIYHLKFLKSEHDINSIYELAKLYHQRWPECLQISINLATLALECGNEAFGVQLLHECASNDSAGHVIERELGKNHAYKSLWPKDLFIILNSPIPAQITVALGWNQLPASAQSIYSSKQSQKPKTDFNFIQKAKTKLIPEKTSARKNNEQDLHKKDANDPQYEIINILEKTGKIDERNLDTRFPVYVVLTSKTKLITKYGEKSSLIILDEINKIIDAVNIRPGWKALSLIPDDVDCMRIFDLDPINEINPWKIKLAIVDLDKYLAKKGQMVGCLLIVGGPEIIPFHALPNPTEDKDSEVLSDNPYATLDSNYFVPEWPVGRLPDEKNNDPGLLLKQIRLIAQKHRQENLQTNWFNFLQTFFLGHVSIREIIRKMMKGTTGFGYSAAVWRRSSIAAFRPIGGGGQLRISPPLNNNDIDLSNLIKAKYTYFNLHGLPDTADWYGQRDLADKSNTPDFPVALTASQFKSCNLIPEVVFSEACYGGFITGKDSDDSIALRLKDQGVIGLIGSTCISYGSMRTPLIGGDLLGYLFFSFLKDGYSIGQAFIQAKIGLVKVMTQRQGYLDGEDQKTLISFTLYGDPLLLSKSKKAIYKNVLRQKTIMRVNSISDQDGIEENETRISGDALEKLKDTLKEYLPNLDNMSVRIKHQKFMIANGSLTKSEKENKGFNLTNRVMVTYSKQITIQKIVHHQFIRATLDDQGRMIKLAVSR